MSDKEPQPQEETHFLDRLTDWTLDDLIVEEETPPTKPEE